MGWTKWRVSFLSIPLVLEVAACAHVDNPPGPPPPRYSAAHAVRQSEPPLPRYSAEKVAALFERPDSAAGLLKNLRIAVDADLIGEPGFGTDESLLKFFGGATLRRETVPDGIGRRLHQQNTFVTVDEAHSAAQSIKVTQGLDRLSDQPGGACERVRRFGTIRMSFAGSSGLTAGMVRAMFGQETLIFQPYNWTEGTVAVPIEKGALFYGNPDDADFMVASLERKTITFFVKMTDEYRALPPYRRGPKAQVLDTDQIDGIVIYDPEP